MGIEISVEIKAPSGIKSARTLGKPKHPECQNEILPGPKARANSSGVPK